MGKHKRDLMFTTTLLVTILILLYFIGASITGYATMYCEEGMCKEFCRFDDDCLGENEICCEKGGFGVCEEASLCAQAYTFEPGADAEINLGGQASLSEYPGPELESKLNFFSILIILALFVAIIYFMNRKEK